MKFHATFIFAILLISQLSACGGGDASNTPGKPTFAATHVQSSAVVPANVQPADYAQSVQRIYVAYFGRPADTSGLAFFQQQFLNAGAPTTIRGINDAYLTNPSVKALIDFFGTSAESNALYNGGTEAFITAIYRNLFNRDPDAGGLAFWSAKVNSGDLTRANAAVSIMAGAQFSDVDIIDKKNQVASNFTAAIDTANEAAGYDGLAANAIVRSMLGTVTNTTDVAAFQTTVNATLTSLANTKLSESVSNIVQNRCISCHGTNGTFPRLNTASLIQSNAGLIFEVTTVSRRMPQGNSTGMTEEERSIISTWFDAGAP